MMPHLRGRFGVVHSIPTCGQKGCQADARYVLTVRLPNGRRMRTAAMVCIEHRFEPEEKFCFWEALL